VAEPTDKQALLTALTTEHFGLQGARSQTISESAARAGLYVSAVSSTLVALGFIGNLSDIGDTFNVFALVALPTLYVLGLFTFVRLVEITTEDLAYGRAINRIRNYYLELAGDRASLFMMSAHDDARGVLWNMGLPLARWQLYFTAAMMVAVVNSVVLGAAVAILVGAVTDAPLGVAVASGGVAAIASVVFLHRHQRSGRRLAGAATTEAMFPSQGAD
jgi:hypothetical protein